MATTNEVQQTDYSSLREHCEQLASRGKWTCRRRQGVANVALFKDGHEIEVIAANVPAWAVEVLAIGPHGVLALLDEIDTLRTSSVTIAERDEARRLYCELAGSSDCGPMGDGHADVARDHGWGYLYETKSDGTSERDQAERHDERDQELERLRARVVINSSDVAQAKVTAATRNAWLRERCEASTGPTPGTTIWSRDGVEVALTWDDAIDDGVQRGETARFINNVAPMFGLTPWALLEQLAAASPSE